MPQSFYVVLALLGGTLLAGMVTFNSQLYLYVSPLLSSWVVHGTGAIAALLAVSIALLQKKARNKKESVKHAPWWSYLGGMPGAFVVVLAVITVNSYLGVTGTLVMSIVGQVLYGLANDHWGWFGFPKQALSVQRLKSVVLIVAGAIMIIYAKGALQ